MPYTALGQQLLRCLLVQIIIQGLPISTTTVTPTGSPYTISYDVYDYAGNKATTVRQLAVIG